jgi:hypothetical protein
MANGITLNGLPFNGTNLNGLPFNGITLNGLPFNGTNGLGLNGQALGRVQQPALFAIDGIALPE